MVSETHFLAYDMSGSTLTFGFSWKKETSQPLMLHKRCCSLSHCKHLWDEKQGRFKSCVHKYREKTFIFHIIYKSVLLICSFKPSVLNQRNYLAKKKLLPSRCFSSDQSTILTCACWQLSQKNLKNSLSSNKMLHYLSSIKVFNFTTLLSLTPFIFNKSLLWAVGKTCNSNTLHKGKWQTPFTVQIFLYFLEQVNLLLLLLYRYIGIVLQ